MSWHSAQSSVCVRTRMHAICVSVCARDRDMDSQCDVLLRTFVTVWCCTAMGIIEPDLHSLYLSFLMVVTVFFWHKIDRKCVNSKQWKHTVFVANATWNVYTSRWSQRVCACLFGIVYTAELKDPFPQKWTEFWYYQIANVCVCVCRVFRCMNVCCKIGKNNMRSRENVTQILCSLLKMHTHTQHTSITRRRKPQEQFLLKLQ